MRINKVVREDKLEYEPSSCNIPRGLFKFMIYYLINKLRFTCSIILCLRPDAGSDRDRAQTDTQREVSRRDRWRVAEY